MKMLIHSWIFIILLSPLAVGHELSFRDGVPRFKITVSNNHEVYLGDKVNLDCNAHSKSNPLVTWTRNGEPVDVSKTNREKYRAHRHNMNLEIRRVEVSDQGLWTCKVQNQMGFITRNFTVEIIDFCYYFRKIDIPPERTPMECICLWEYMKTYHRNDLDYKQATEENCQKYRDRIMRRSGSKNVRPCWDPPCPILEESADSKKKYQYSDEDDYEDDEDDEEGVRPVPSKPKEVEPDADDSNSTSTPTNEPDVEREDQQVFFKDGEEKNYRIVSPAGRTLKLSCKGGGWPPPKVVWSKDDRILTRTGFRMSGSEYAIGRWTMELEDATESDSGIFECELYNRLGSLRRIFNVTVVNRMRSPPFIVPNILINQTVNINETAKFICRVVSDLVPHIMWVRIERVNGSHHYFNQSAREYMFQYTELQFSENAIITHNRDESILELFNVTLEDQGIYACISGNSLGTTMANATLNVNEFTSLFLATGEGDPEYTMTDYIITAVLLLLITVLIVLLVAYFTCIRYAKKKEEERVGLLPRKKKVIITRIQPEGKDCNGRDLPGSFKIEIKECDPGKGPHKRNSTSDQTILTEYEFPTDPEWEIERKRLDLVEILGEGAFGEVWKASLKPEAADRDDAEDVDVAVKKLKASATDKELIDLVGEMKLLTTIGYHENILRLIGCCTGCGPLYVVLELCKHGNLRDFLRAHRPQEENKPQPIVLPAQKLNQDLSDYLEPIKLPDNKFKRVLIPHLRQRHLVEFAYQVAKGMEYLASRKIIHRDLAARNVLVADNFTLKISDFGLSRDIHYADYYRKRTNGRLPIKWMALEALQHEYTMESDVWSYGILLWEIMTLGGTPYPTIAMQKLFSCLIDGYRMEAPHNCPEEIYSLMMACWQKERNSRPKFDTIVSYLDWMLVQAVEEVEKGHHTEAETHRSGSPDDIHPMSMLLPPSHQGSMNKRRRLRPLSAPVFLPSDVIPTICDDNDDDISPELFAQIRRGNIPKAREFISEKAPLLKNEITSFHPDYSIPVCRLVRQSTDPGLEPDSPIEETLHYYEPRALPEVIAQSVDSAIGSPAWPLDEHFGHTNINYGSPFLGEVVAEHIVEAPYARIATRRAQTTKFPFPPNLQINNNRATLYTDVPPLHLPGNIYQGTTNLGFLPSPNPYYKDAQKIQLDRRYSAESRSSSGRGGSSAVSSAEGLGGIAQFCTVEIVDNKNDNHLVNLLENSKETNI